MLPPPEATINTFYVVSLPSYTGSMFSPYIIGEKQEIFKNTIKALHFLDSPDPLRLIYLQWLGQRQYCKYSLNSKEIHLTVQFYNCFVVTYDLSSKLQHVMILQSRDHNLGARQLAHICNGRCKWGSLDAICTTSAVVQQAKSIGEAAFAHQPCDSLNDHSKK